MVEKRAFNQEEQSSGRELQSSPNQITNSKKEALFQSPQ